MATSKKIREQPISPAVVATAELIRHIKLEDPDNEHLYHKVCVKDYRAVARKERAKEFEVDREDLGEQELLSFQFKYCDGCQWADQDKVGSGHPCCTFITTPHIVDGECRTRKIKGSDSVNTSDNTSDNTDPLASLVIRTATDGQKEHRIQLGEKWSEAKTLKACVLGLAAAVGWGGTMEDILAALQSMPESNNKDLLLSILGGEHEGA